MRRVLDCELPLTRFKKGQTNKQTDIRTRTIAIPRFTRYAHARYKHVFENTAQPRTLCNIFVDSPPQLPNVNTEGLLQIAEKGREIMLLYVRQYTLVPPLEIRQKRRRNKLKTFTKARDTSKKLNTKLNQATLMLSSAYK